MSYQLAQLNIARFRLPKNNPVNADFVNNIDRVNEIGESQPGFVWRFIGSGNDEMDAQVFGDSNIIINMSVWSDIDSLVAFTYRNDAHLEIMRRRKEWFDKMEFYMVLWWIESGQYPSLEEAKHRLDILRQNGATAQGFTFKNTFPAPDSDGSHSSALDN